MAPQPFVPLANGAQVEIVSIYLGQIVENRLWFVTRFDPVDSTLVQALAVGVSAWYRANVLPSLAQNLALLYVRATDWTASPAPSTYEDTTAGYGGSAEDGHSANVSIRVAFRGDSSQEWPNNSNFVPGIPLSAVDGNYYNNTIKTALRNAYIDLIDLTFHFEATHNWQWRVTSRIVNGEYRTEQASARTDLITLPSPTISPRRKRLP